MVEIAEWCIIRSVGISEHVKASGREETQMVIEGLVSLSCKNKGLKPSCTLRLMIDAFRILIIRASFPTDKSFFV